MSDSEASDSEKSSSTRPSDLPSSPESNDIEAKIDDSSGPADDVLNPTEGSILFQPHRTIGLISTSQPFTLSNGTSHLDRFITMPLQERFVIYKCDTIKPVLVSDCLQGTRKQTNEEKLGISAAGERLHYAVSESSLGITVATHGYKGRWSASHASLYKRTKVIDFKSIVKNSSWGIVNVVNLGKSKFPVEVEKDNHDDKFEDSDEEIEEKGEVRMENSLVLAFICAKNSFETISEEEEIVGDDSEDSDSESDDDMSSEESDSDDESTEETRYNGEVVIVVASRRKITIQKRIPLSSVANFTPSIAIHPHTYLNKILIGGNNGEMILLNIRSGKVIHKFQCLQNEDDTKISAIEQSPAVDTVAVGTRSGMVHLINIRMDVKLFSLNHKVSKSSRNKGKAEITSLSFRTDALALEHGIAPMAVGQMNGNISVWDLTPKSNDDDSDDEFTSNKDGRRTLLCQMDAAHKGGVAELKYLPQEPLLLSSGVKSNSLIMHIFDNPNHNGRILKQRVGHVAPPTVIQYQHSSNGTVLASMSDGTDAASCQILSCGGKGDNSLRVFSTARSVLDREYGQGKGLEKRARELGLEGGKADLLLKPITAMASCEAKTREWGDLVTIHQDHAIAYVWSTRKKSQSGPVLRQEDWNVSAMKVQPPKTTHATAVAMSACGNFALVGTKGGVIYKYNVQSGMPRGSFPRDATDSKKGKKGEKMAGNINRTTKMLERTFKVHKLHNEKEKDSSVLEAQAIMKSKLQMARHVDAAVVGLAVDALNKTLISAGSDGKLILWSFATHAPHRKSPIHLSAPATKLVHARDSNLLAIALEDYSVVLFDFSSLNVVRKFSTEGSSTRHNGPISDVAFGPDGRNLYTASLDGTVRVWDVPTNTCIDWLTFASAPTALTLSTTGEFLATAHQGRLGISLWCDRSFFQTVHLNGAEPPSKPFQMDEPAAVAEEEDESVIVQRATSDKNKFLSSSFTKSTEKGSADDNDEAVVPKGEGLITLSGLPVAHWKNLFHLELVKERNKPTEAPKKPVSAPFFLQWRGGESMGAVEPSTQNETSKIAKNDDDEWEAAWVDDDGQEKSAPQREEKRKNGEENDEEMLVSANFDKPTKKTKIKHFRSDLATLLEKCSSSNDYELVTEHLASMGPSAIDVAFSSLCHGMHDLDEGLHLLHLCSKWLLQACSSRRSYEVINAYLHRFLHIHSTTIAGVDDSTDKDLLDRPEHENALRLELLHTIKLLNETHDASTAALKNKMQETLCLLRHFSRMV